VARAERHGYPYPIVARKLKIRLRDVRPLLRNPILVFDPLKTLLVIAECVPSAHP
jgi:hypothetical protein